MLGRPILALEPLVYPVWINHSCNVGLVNHPDPCHPDARFCPKDLPHSGPRSRSRISVHVILSAPLHVILSLPISCHPGVHVTLEFMSPWSHPLHVILSEGERPSRRT